MPTLLNVTNRLREKVEILKQEIEITRNDIYTVRLAGLLHDIGHCFFSHASEKMMKPILEAVIKSQNIGMPKPHEFLSYLIVTNDYFVDYWKSCIAPLFSEPEDEPDIVTIAKMIIGIPSSDEKRYLQEIISGAYDVDKLEYLYRDARTAGLEISYDIERYFYQIMIFEHPQGTWRLVMGQGGVSAVEQIIFSKMMLFSFVYHHQKVLASDALVTDLISELLSGEPESCFKIEHPLDILRFTDSDVLSYHIPIKNENLNRIRKKILNRDLPKRCFVINREFVENLETDLRILQSWDALKENLRGLPEEVMKIRENIVKGLQEMPNSKEISIEDVFIVMPEVPAIAEPATAPVVDVDGNLHSMSEFFDLKGWQTTYDIKKLRGYFYISEEYKHEAANVIEEYLKQSYNLTFKTNAKSEAKIKSENTV